MIIGLNISVRNFFSGPQLIGSSCEILPWNYQTFLFLLSVNDKAIPTFRRIVEGIANDSIWS